jgi:hypothetical protein
MDSKIDKLADAISLLNLISIACDAIADDRVEDAKAAAGHVRDTAALARRLAAAAIGGVAEGDA